MPVIYFMGSYGNGAGMDLYSPGMGVDGAPPPKSWPFGAGLLDGTYAPNKPNQYRRHEEPQGHARVTLVDEWTVLSFWDRSGPDERGGINSTFAIEGTHSPREALALSMEHFPQVFERHNFAVKLEGLGWLPGRTA